MKITVIVVILILLLLFIGTGNMGPGMTVFLAAAIVVGLMFATIAYLGKH